MQQVQDIGLIQVLSKNVSQVCFNHRKQDNHKLQRFLSRPLPQNRWQNTNEEPESCIQVLSRPSMQFFQEHGYVHMH